MYCHIFNRGANKTNKKGDKINLRTYIHRKKLDFLSLARHLSHARMNKRTHTCTHISIWTFKHNLKRCKVFTRILQSLVRNMWRDIIEKEVFAGERNKLEQNSGQTCNIVYYTADIRLKDTFKLRLCKVIVSVSLDYNVWQSFYNALLLYVVT